MTSAQRNAEAARKLKERIAQQLKRGAGKGVEAAVRFLAARVKETLSVPAPKVAIRGAALPGKKLGPILGYRVTTKATKGAPPRMVTGRMRQGVSHRMLSPILGVVGVHARAEPTKRHPAGFNYPKYHETGDEGDGGQLGGGPHPYLKSTADKYAKELKTIIGTEAKVALRT